MRKKVRIIVGYIFLFLFIAYYGSITLFWHTHHIGEITIVHSHPFNNPGDSHSTAEYDLIKILSIFSGLAASTGLILAIRFFGNKIALTANSDSRALQFFSQVCFRRGPPSISIV